MNEKDTYISDVMHHNIKSFRGHLLYYACALLGLWKSKEEVRLYLEKIYLKKHKQLS